MSRAKVQRMPRIQTSLAATLVDSYGGELPVQIIDLSSGGFRLRTTEQLVVGEEVQFRTSRYGDFRAKLHWVEGYEAGGQFLDQITL